MFKLGVVMNNVVTSEDAILAVCRRLVFDRGLSFLNMRTVAKECKVALGSIYYYFPSKDDLLIATIKSVWEDIFSLDNIDITNFTFSKYIDFLFEHIRIGIKKYPNFFTIHSVSFSTKGQNKAHDCMKLYLAKIRKDMLQSLNLDKNVNRNTFSNEFTIEDFVDFVLSSFISLLMKNQDDCRVLLEIIKRTVY